MGVGFGHGFLAFGSDLGGDGGMGLGDGGDGFGFGHGFPAFG